MHDQKGDRGDDVKPPGPSARPPPSPLEDASSHLHSASFTVSYVTTHLQLELPLAANVSWLLRQR